jgi:hypothetical protein
MVVIAIVVAACTPASNVGRSPSTSTPSPSPNDIPSPKGSAAPTSEPSPTALTGWQQAAPMVHPRSIFRAVVLTDGAVLAVGDDDCGAFGAVAGSERAEIYDPSADRWVEVGSLNKPRDGLMLVALPDGAAMVLGGSNQEEESFSSTKIYAPIDRTWSPGPQMLDIPVQGAAALRDGTVIAVAGAATEILDVGATAWRRSNPPTELSIDRLVSLADGRVLASGAYPDFRADDLVIFDPKRETWAQFATPSSVPPWSDLIPLTDGSIFHIGSDEGGSRVERYDPAVKRWNDVAPLREGRVRPQMTQLADGRVLVAGGMSIKAEAVEGGTGVFEVGGLDTTEIYDPASDSWTSGPRLNASRQAGFAATLSDGSVLVYGGMVPTPMSDGEFDTGQAGECPAPVIGTERLYVVP